VIYAYIVAIPLVLRIALLRSSLDTSEVRNGDRSNAGVRTFVDHRPVHAESRQPPG